MSIFLLISKITSCQFCPEAKMPGVAGAPSWSSPRGWGWVSAYRKAAREKIETADMSLG
jgi:hypothetical protein